MHDNAAPVDQGGGDAMPWLAGGLLILGMGGAVAALRRRRRDSDVVVDGRTPVEPVTVADTSRAIAPDEPIYATSYAEDRPIAPAVLHNRDATVPIDDREAMIAAAPTADNPFLTRRNRLRRASFLLRQHENVAADNRGTINVPAPEREMARTQVYDFGKQERGRPSILPKPAFRRVQ
jgi:hypothetical protein